MPKLLTSNKQYLFLKKSFLNFTEVFGVFLFSFLFVSTSLAQQNSLTLFYNNEQIKIESEILNAWEEPYTWNSTSNLKIVTVSTQAKLFEHFSGQKNNISKKSYFNHNPEKIYDYLSSLKPKIDQETKEPELILENNKAVKFTPPKEGIKSDMKTTTFNIISSLQNSSTSSEIALTILKPKKELGDQNHLGIKELIARGESSFKGSPKNRRHNIQIGLEKIAGAIVLPGEEFSFNNHLGPVEEDQGFLPELVIKKTGTVPELGGGLCQVSSTTFRAAMKAGLPITQRKNHSYAVQYYAPQGTDATIYPGVIDLKFVNDTPGAILIWPYLKDKDTLIFDFYGTKDNREVVLSKPYTYDRKEDGSMKATWERTVFKNGESIKNVFNSVYLSPALFHKEETFISSTSPTNLN